jgi:hypothetical protein
MVKGMSGEFAGVAVITAVYHLNGENFIPSLLKGNKLGNLSS